MNANKKPAFEGAALTAFRDGMIYAANLKWHCEPCECDGVDAMKKVIRERAENLKELPTTPNPLIQP